ncbi:MULTISPECIES: hypothetical protein [unclassified Streptomyces]|uniref:hypothetical protein n=1 Tax=unclassified Streptomyces TaxID=2593676 RepID=UPI003652E84D
MSRRLISLLLALAFVLGLGASASPAWADDPTPRPSHSRGVGEAVLDGVCRHTVGSFLDNASKVIGGIGGNDFCRASAKVVAKEVNEAWKSIQDSIFGDFITACTDVTKWLLKLSFTSMLINPSIDLNATGLWNKESGRTGLAGALAWLGLVVAAGGFVWQLGRMAVTGQMKHAGRAMAGWAENMLISAVGVGLIALLLQLGDEMSRGLVKMTFYSGEEGWKDMEALMVPKDLANPIQAAGVTAVLIPFAFLQILSMFLRELAIPILALMLPIAGAGRVGGDTLRKWLPALITSVLVIVAHKPLLAIIMCTGYAQVGNPGLLEWLRGCVTMLLALIAPLPLMKVFMPFGMAVGSGMSAGGGASGALAGAAGFFAGGSKKGGESSAPSGPDSSSSSSSSSPSGPPPGPPSAVAHAQYVERNRKRGDDDEPEGGVGPVPGPRKPGGGGGTSGQAAEGEAASTGSAAAGGPAAIVLATTIEVIDGVNNTIKSASDTAGGGS